MRRWMAGAVMALGAMAGACDDGDGSAAEPVDGALADAGSDAEPAADMAPPAEDAGPDATPDAAGPPAPPTGAVVQLAGDTGSGFVDGVGPAARFNGITCAALAADGDALYVSDTFNGTVRAVDLDTRAVTTLAGRPLEFATLDGGPGAARFSAPRGCAATADALWIADGPTLRRIALPDLAVETFAGQPGEPGMVDGPGPSARLGYLLHDLEPSADGAALYISDRSNDRIRALDLATREVSTLVGPAGDLDGPGGIARVGEALYVADTFDGELVRVDLPTGEVEVVADGLDAPQGVAISGGKAWLAGFDGALYRVDLETGEVDVPVGVAGDNRAVDGLPPGARLGGAFAPPVVDADRKQLYYVDLDAGGVRRIDLGDFEVAPVAGPEAPYGHRDGPDPRFGVLYDVARAGAAWWLSDPGNNAIRAVDAAGGATTVVGVPGEPGAVDGPAADARLDAPIGLAVVDAEVYVADYGADALRALTGDPPEVATVAGPADGLAGPWGLGAGPDGAIYITELERGAVRRWSRDAGLEELAPPGRFDTPTDVAVDPRDGAIYVADAVRAAIYRLEPDGRAIPVVGQPGETGVRDGPLSEALLGEPLGLTFAPDGGLLVADGGNHLIRRVDLDAGVITRWLGHPVRHGGRSPGAEVPWSEATLERPQAVALDEAGALGVVSDAALIIARPEATAR